MVHKSSLIPGLSKFIDENILAQYSPNSMKRIMMAGAISLYLKQGESMVDTLTSNPLFTGLGVVHEGNMIDIDVLRDTLKAEVNKAGFVRLNIPFIGAIDFTSDDITALHKFIVEANTTQSHQSLPQTNSTFGSNGGVY